MSKASLGVDTTLKGRMSSSDVSAGALQTPSTRLQEELDVAEQGDLSALRDLCGLWRPAYSLAIRNERTHF